MQTSRTGLDGRQKTPSDDLVGAFPPAMSGVPHPLRDRWSESFRGGTNAPSWCSEPLRRQAHSTLLRCASSFQPFARRRCHSLERYDHLGHEYDNGHYQRNNPARTCNTDETAASA
ncbi:MAG: hypothetical protein WA161_06570 [Pseudomonas sp.]|uniref:hypothetical protein n=1 Tax=Pseudomonas sp. TaxID=306 RepID=UPI003BB75F36